MCRSRDSGKNREEFAMEKDKKIAQKLGKEGEQKALALYREWGYTVLTVNNVFPGLGELDFVVQKQQLLVFVEVRTRGISSVVHPFDTVTSAKRSRMLRAARLFWESASHELRSQIEEIRFDVVSVQEQNCGWIITPIFGAFEGNDIWQ